MATTRPFSYNTGSPIAGTIQVGDLAVGYPTTGYTGMEWWNGPDEDLGYVIAQPVSGDTQPTPVTINEIFLSSVYRGTDIVLSNNNQTAYQQFGYQQSVLGTVPIGVTDKVMFSVLVSLAAPPTLPNSHFIGIGYQFMNYQGNPYGGYPGNDGNSMGYGSDGNIWYNGSIYLGGLQTWTTGDIIDIIINNDVSTMWVRVNGGYWNNSLSDNPETNAGGLEIIGGPFYPALCPAYEGTMTIQNTSTYVIPNGYTFLGSTLASVGFFRTNGFDDNEFVDIANILLNENYSDPYIASSALTSNGYWNSYVSNLVLYLDASDSNSYPGTGTVWYDISGNGNDVTMENVGNITWNNTGPVYFSTGSNGWFSNPSGTNLPVGNSEYTYIIWVQLGSIWNGNGFMSIGPFGNGNESNAFRAISTNQLLNYWWGNDLSVSSSVSPTNGWFNAVAKYDGITRSIWVNGSLVGTDTPGGGHNVTTSALQIAKTTGSEFLNGNVGEVLIYNIAIPDPQIPQYFNNTKSRFGL